MADETFKGEEKARFPALLVLGILMAGAVIAVGFIVDAEIGIPLLLLLAICVVAAVGFRVIAGRGTESDADQGGLPKSPTPDRERPLGDTAEAHDEINPHDLPKDNPGRPAAEQMVQSGGGTTAGHDDGGAAGEGGPGDRDRVGADEAKGGAQA